MKYLQKTEIIDIPSGVKVTAKSRVVTVKGPRGEITKQFKHVKIEIEVKDNKIYVHTYMTTYKQSAILYTIASHIKNMIKGVTVGFRYKMHTVKKHFPIEVGIKDGAVEIGRFLGERNVKTVK